MLQISDSLILKYSEVKEISKLEEFINKKIYTKSDTPLTYRQINSLGTDRLLSEDRENEKGWRKFSFKELIYIQIVNELKKFGLKHEQLKELHKEFNTYGEVVIGVVFAQVEILITVNETGHVVFYDPANYALLLNPSKTHLQIQLNNFVNNLLVKLGKTPVRIKWSIKKDVLDAYRVNLSSKEEELLKIVRDENYDMVRVKKKNGAVAIVYAEKNKDKNEIKPRDLINILETKDFMDLTVVKRDGKIVDYNLTDTIKL